MRICPKCRKEYDDTWDVCLKCGIKLSRQELPKDMGVELERIEARLRRLEKAAGIESPAPAAAKAQTAAPERDKTEIKTEGKDIESTIGLVWLNRIGLVAIFLGVAFFLKYAFDSRWIGELGRVIIGLAAGFGMIVGSEFARRKDYTVISQGLHGGGVAILYLSIFSAFGFYHLIGVVPAFIFMGVVTLYCGFWAARTNWISSAVIGMIGGFLTPFLIGMDKIPPSALLSYVALLDIGILFISFYKRWGALNIGSFFLTNLVYFSWYASGYKPERWIFAASFATAFFGIFCLLSIVRNLMHRERSDSSDIILVLSNGVAYFLWLFNILKTFAGPLPGLLPLSLACLYIGYSYSTLARSKEDKGLILSYVGLAVLFVTIAIPVQLKYNWVAISWAVEALVLVWLGFRLGYSDIRKIGLYIGAASLFKILLLDYSYYPVNYAKNAFIFNERMYTYLTIVLIVFVCAWLYKKNRSLIAPGEKSISNFLVLAANFVLLVQFSVESKTYFAHIAHLKEESGLSFAVEYGKLFSARELTLSLLWVIYAFVLVAAGIYRRFRALRVMALILFGVAIFKIFLLDISQLDRIYKIVSFITLGGVLVLASFFYQKYKDEIHDFALRGD